jgi:hypothetical protein
VATAGEGQFMREVRTKRVLLVSAALFAVGVVALVWAVGTPSSEAQTGTLQSCPSAGMWSIAVWDGASGTAAADALATCGEGAVDAAYALDAQTGVWSRWFAGKPGVSDMPPLADMQGVLALGSAAGPLVTPTATATPSPTVPPTGAYTFTFPSFYSEADTFQGTVTETRMMDSIPYPTVTPPAGGQFAVVLMTVTNIGSQAADVGSYSFRLRDDQGRAFALLEFIELLNAQNAAELYFDRAGVFDIIMPGTTLEMVFVFLVPEGTTGLVAERCDAGCSSF